MNKPKNTGLIRWYKALCYSSKGLRAAWLNEAAFRQETMAAALLIPVALWLPVTKLEQIALIASVVLVMVVELLNSSVEAVVDRIGAEHHELAGRAKDMGSAAVLLCLILWAYIWISILFF